MRMGAYGGGGPTAQLGREGEKRRRKKKVEKKKRVVGPLNIIVHQVDFMYHNVLFKFGFM